MIKIREAIVVEGRYDKNTLCQLVDAVIIETAGFGIFKDTEKMNLLRMIAAQKGLIIFTDSDGAGFVIRNRIKGSIPSRYLKHAYIPDIYGKEKRKKTPGKEGKLGVEGMHPEILLEALISAGATIEDKTAASTQTLTKNDLVELGLSGGQGSSTKRLKLQKRLGFPEHMSANSLLQALSLLYSAEDLKNELKNMETNNG